MTRASIPGAQILASEEARKYYERGAAGDATALYNFAVCLETGQVNSSAKWSFGYRLSACACVRSVKWRV